MMMRRMTRMGRLSVVICSAIASLVASSPTYGQTGSALVLETSRAIVPHLPAYSEIPSDTTVSLPSRAKLVFLHYYTCRTVTVVGGTVTFGANRYDITGGTKESDVHTPCPRTVTLKAGGEVAGAVFRSGSADGMLTLSTQPTFVLVGKRAGDFTSVRVSKAGQKVLEAPLDGRRFRWPIGVEPLAQATKYELTLVPSSAGAVPVTMRFMAKALTVPPAGEVLTLISAE
jgi:hypothetical protein